MQSININVKSCQTDRKNKMAQKHVKKNFFKDAPNKNVTLES